MRTQYADRFSPRLSLPVLLLGLLVPPLGTGCSVLRDIIASISDGAACSSHDECLGGTCLTDGFPAGYCTTLQCETEGCSNIFGSECLLLGSLRNEPACYVDCSLDADCRDNYRCSDIDGARVCLPAEAADRLPSAGDTGTSCSRDADCRGGTCLQTLAGGYCTLLNCTDDAECDGVGDGRCLQRGDGGTSYSACFDGCQDDDECARFGYACVDPDGGGGVCDQLDEANPVRNPDGADDGEPCVVGINCKGGTCLRAQEGYPGGYCTTLSCGLVGCNGDAICRSLENGAACFIRCGSNADCREGYECLGEGYCGPPIRTVPPTDPTGSIDIVCQSEQVGGAHRFAFNIDGSTESFAVVPLSDSNMVDPTTLRLPDGSVGADMRGDYRFLGEINPFFLVNIAPLFFPAAPQFRSITQQGGGQYTLDIETQDSQPCFYVLEKAAEGSQISLNFYYVGVPGLNASSAPNDSDLLAMIDGFERIYNEAGVQLATVRHFDASQDIADRYRIVRNFNDVFELVSSSQPPGSSLAEQLSANVFLIQDFAMPDSPGTVGISAGLPGVPGLHGTNGSGLIFSTTMLGVDNRAMGSLMAHEAGHFNGLRHTTEQTGDADPISDTPRCSDVFQGPGCPDATNFMFPFVLGGLQQTDVSDGQAQVLRWAPLVQ